jgi:hypothetical protein
LSEHQHASTRLGVQCTNALTLCVWPDHACLSLGQEAAVMLADRGAPAVLALAPDAVMLADAGAPAVLVPAPDAVMLADGGAPAVLALALEAVMLADAGAPAVLAPALAVMLADAVAPAFLELALAAVLLPLLAPPLRCALPLPLPLPFPLASRLPQLLHIVSCSPFQPGCALPRSKTPRCPQCTQPAAVRFTGAVTAASAGPRESVVLAGAHGAGGKEA